MTKFADGYVLAGTKSGFLLRYRVRSIDDSLGFDAQHDFQVCKTFSKKPVTQLKILPESSLLLSLTDGVVEVHDLNQAKFPLLSVVPKSKNASCFSTCEWDTQLEERGGAASSGDSYILLAVAIRRKCQLYSLSGKDFVIFSALNEVNFSDTVRSVALLGNYMVAAVRDEYFHVTLVGDTNTDPGLMRSLFTVGSYGKGGESFITVMQDRRIFACRRDDLTHFFCFNGELAVHDGYENIRWSDVPTAVEYDNVYLIGLLPKVIEVRSVKPSFLIQSVELQKVKLITRSSCGFLYCACSTASNQTDLFFLDANAGAIENVQRLVKEKQYELAVQIAETIASGQGSGDRRKRVRDVKFLYAFHLFSKRRFQEAFDIYCEIKADVLYVIGLFPDLLPNEIRRTISYPGPLPTELPKHDMQRALIALTSFLSEIRTNIARRLDLHKKSKILPSIGVGESLKLSSEEEVAQMRNSLEIVDTTLLKCYLKYNDILVSSLLRLPDNSCNIAESEAMLKEHGKYSELFLLYERKSMHDKALQLLREQADEADVGCEIFDRAVSYLQDLGANHFDLICEYAKWILQEKPELLLKIFTEDCEPVKELNKFKVLEFIQEHCPENVTPYLEYVVYQWNDENERFHDILGEKYIKEVKDLYMSYGPDQPGTQFPASAEKPFALLVAEKKLLSFLETSIYYNPEILLVQLPHFVMHEARAAIFGRLKRHDQVLAIYVNILRDCQSARNYCCLNYEEDDPSASQLFLRLFQFYINPPSNSILGVSYATLPSPSRMVNQALEVLFEFSNRMDTSKALAELSSNVALADLSIPLQKVILDTLDTTWEAGLKRNVTEMLHAQVQASRMQWQGERIVINHESQCANCQKKIDNSAFVRFADGTLVHYYCFKKESTSS
ncbi:vesicle fusion protein; vam vps protein [Trichuris trichiura]|uniref:Vesicle fusion protein vam vps protein n=1 Tax=Trichuris trichiura TaxID=36087 RepID=A0A077Z2N3_TRITR|nr:vesicle fusion protein; vam vps protein [Trichuris trichiura]